MCLIALTFINMVSVANIFCAEIPIFLREQQNNMYRIDLYYVSKMLAELPLFLITPVVFNLIFYWMVGLNPDAGRFAVSTGITLLVTEVGLSSTNFELEPVTYIYQMQLKRLSSVSATSSPARHQVSKWHWPWDLLP